MTVMVTPRQENATRRVGPGLYRKHALPLTSFVYKDGRRIEVTPDFLLKMKANFDARVRDSVPVPAKGAAGHSDDWRDSVGETVGFEVDPDKGAYVIVRVNDEADKAIASDRLKGVSLAFDPDWFDPRLGKKIGPVLRHTALTNIPYINGTEPFEAVSLSEPDDELILLAEDPAAFPADRDEIDRLSGVALSETVVATLGSPEDRAEVERLRLVAAELLTGTPVEAATEARGDETSDADEIARLTKIAKETR